MQQYSYRDYSNRIAIWRMLDVFDKYNVKCGISINMGVLDHFPEITKAFVDRGYDFTSHGWYNTAYLSSVGEEEERKFYQDQIATLKRTTGKTLKGMLSPAISATERTPDLMAEAGLYYFCDLLQHDDQPSPIIVEGGKKMISIPFCVETNDYPILNRHFEGEDFVRVCKDQFDQLYKEGAESSNIFCLGLHPNLVGSPHRIKYLEEIVRYIMGHDGVWNASADDIADHYMANYYDKVMAHAQKFNK